MSAAAKPRALPTRTARWLLWIALLGGGAFFVALALIFAWPSAERARFELGPAEEYPIGSVTTIEDGNFHLVRLSEEMFIALSWVDPHLGCTVPWRPGFVWPDPATGEPKQGWFRNPCHGETYDTTGRRIFGPSPRDLDRFPVSIANGRVIVQTDRYVCGFAPPGSACVEQKP